MQISTPRAKPVMIAAMFWGACALTLALTRSCGAMEGAVPGASLSGEEHRFLEEMRGWGLGAGS